MKQMLSSVMDGLKSDEGRKELWKNYNASDADGLASLEEVSLGINLKTG